MKTKLAVLVMAMLLLNACSNTFQGMKEDIREDTSSNPPPQKVTVVKTTTTTTRTSDVPTSPPPFDAPPQ